MKTDATSQAVEHLLRSVPEPGSEETPKLRTFLTSEFEGRDVYNVSVTPPKGERRAGVLSLEEGRAALYQLASSLTLSRELLHLEGAVVRHDVPLDDGSKASLSITLADKRVLTVELLETDTQTKLRDKLETRATA